MINSLKQQLFPVLLSPGVALSAAAQQLKKDAPLSGNPLFKGWYADPEAIIFNKQYWIFPTYSAPYNKQVFFDAFSAKDLVTWTKHERILDTAAIKWAKRAVWAPSIIKKKNILPCTLHQDIFPFAPTFIPELIGRSISHKCSNLFQT